MMKTTKQLARELGLLRKRTLSCSGASNNGRIKCSSDQPFKYLIVIDFESTCWQDGKFRTQEINGYVFKSNLRMSGRIPATEKNKLFHVNFLFYIEFPAVLLHTLTGEVISEFHYYVQPQEQPILSRFCTELTGITQDRVDDGIPVNLCLRKFTHWLDKLHREKGVVCSGTTTDHTVPVNTTCVTWSDWDLGVCLQYECKRKQLLKPPQLNSWIDLRATYRKFYDRKPNGLNGALQDLCIQFEGREHSGVDDARNTAKLAYRMIKDGCILKVTKTLKGHERSSSCNPNIESYFPTRTEPKIQGKPKQSHKSPKSSSKKQTPSKCVINKRTPAKQQQKITPRKFIVGNSPVMKTREKNTPQDNGSIPVGKETPYKEKQNNTNTKKRKQITPVKIFSDIGTNSPCHKIQRKISPKKFSPSNIFVDPKSSTNIKTDNDIRPQTGLKVHDTNVDSTSSINVFKKPSPVVEKSISNNIPLKMRTGSVFKVPHSVDKSGDTLILDKRSFCASTPLHSHPMPKSFNQSTNQSPVLSLNETNLSKNKPANASASTSVISQPKLFSTPRPVVQSSTSVDICSGQTSTMNYQTPSNSRTSINLSSGSRMKITPPLCKCGRRSKRRMAQSPGQNMGRFFFSCSVRKGMGSKDGCEFFKWETGPCGNSSVNKNTSIISKQFTPVVNCVKQWPQNSQKKSLGVRSGLSQRVYTR